MIPSHCHVWLYAIILTDILLGAVAEWIFKAWNKTQLKKQGMDTG
jgi:hypothetical protein